MSQQAHYQAIAALNADDLVEMHAPLVRRIADHLKARLPENVETEDLVQVGLMALLEAARNFSADKGASFTTYAGIRIRGAMLDEVRAMGWTPRSVHRKQREKQQRCTRSSRTRDAKQTPPR